MKIFVNGKHITNTAQSVSFVHRGLVISAADGPEMFFEVVVFPDADQRFPFEVDLAARQFPTIPEAVAAADKLADAIELGLIELIDR